jgi:hypothetical protein
MALQPPPDMPKPAPVMSDQAKAADVATNKAADAITKAKAAAVAEARARLVFIANAGFNREQLEALQKDNKLSPDGAIHLERLNEAQKALDEALAMPG